VDGGHRAESPAPAEAVAVDEGAFVQEMTPLLQQLQGEWLPVAMVSSGQVIPQAMLAFGTRTMRGNEVKVVFNGQTMVHAKVRIEESKTPVAVDYMNVGRGPRLVTHGILELRAGLARFCMASPGAPRPAGFESVAGDGLFFSEWKRK
jgi:uncharacterized protein (TIGR03067 family)